MPVSVARAEDALRASRNWTRNKKNPFFWHLMTWYTSKYWTKHNKNPYFRHLTAWHASKIWKFVHKTPYKCPENGILMHFWRCGEGVREAQWVVLDGMEEYENASNH